MSIDHLLMIGFGAPSAVADVPAFLERVTHGLNIPPARLQDVAHHYERVGGSPYNAHAQRLFDAVSAALRKAGVTLPLFLGMRNWDPLLPDALRQVREQGLHHGLGLILASHRSYSSFGKYVENVEDAKIASDARDVHYDYLKPWHLHPGYIEAQADRVRGLIATADPKQREATHLLFCAHSIPMAMPGRPQYEEEFRASSGAVAKALKHQRWSIAYQSRSGSPRDPWLEPDVQLVLRELRDCGTKRVVVVPIGFLFDHVEVLFDLDIEAAEIARRLEIELLRAPTVMDHPKFVAMWVELVQQHIAAAQPAASAPASQPWGSRPR